MRLVLSHLQRYAQGSGLTPERQAFREGLRLEAAGRFAAGQDSLLIAKELRVHVRSVQRWRRARRPRGPRRCGPARRTRAALDAWLVFEDEAGFSRGLGLWLPGAVVGPELAYGQLGEHQAQLVSIGGQAHLVKVDPQFSAPRFSPRRVGDHRSAGIQALPLH